MQVENRGTFSYNTQLNYGTPCHRLVRAARSSPGFKELLTKTLGARRGNLSGGTKHKYHFFCEVISRPHILATGRAQQTREPSACIWSVLVSGMN